MVKDSGDSLIQQNYVIYCFKNTELLIEKVLKPGFKWLNSACVAEPYERSHLQTSEPT